MAASTETLTLEVATPVGLALRTEADSVEAPSVHGAFGVLPGHLPLLAALRPGILRYHAEGKEYVVAIGAGFVEAEPNRVQILTEQFARPEQIESATVQKELANAEAALKSFDKLHEGAEYAELQRAIDWALAQLEAVLTARK